METTIYLQQQLGLMTWPLIICSSITVTIIVERLVQVMLHTRVGHRSITKLLAKQDINNQADLDSISGQLKQKRGRLSRGIAMLIAHREFSKAIREDSAGMWLQQQRDQLRSGLRLLALIGVVAPLLGLLGTVLGLIDMFRAVAASTGAITPNDLASGLGVAMRTTAAGLIVALPAIASAQLLGLWADRVVGKLEHAMNCCNLWIEGVSLGSTS
ncbi:MotA/TolQ/ExbB proton channel family protein [Aliivibrio kagoshimensis]|uniref:MotA/TolQ/ExbB proton channel family protein n=1 Tax=Aliivibrio kagoshimensis TaxID=2910230 RepID=UPI003D151DA4